MKKQIVAILLCTAAVFLLNSCESCVKSVSKKVTELGISAIEGVSEAVTEHGEEAGEGAMDALGTIAKGAGRSLDRQLNEHAEHVASVAGRTFVQSLEGFDKGAVAEYYDEISFREDFPSGVALEFFGKIKSKPVVDAYFIILETGKYACTFELLSADNKVLLSKSAEIDKTSAERKFSVVSFALNSSEENMLKQTEVVKVSVKKS